jgi:hypothetical protein
VGRVWANWNIFNGGLNVIFYQNMSNLYNQYKSVERKISQNNQVNSFFFWIKFIKHLLLFSRKDTLSGSKFIQQIWLEIIMQHQVHVLSVFDRISFKCLLFVPQTGLTQRQDNSVLLLQVIVLFNILWTAYSCLGISTAFSLPDLIIILLFQVTSFKESFFSH